MGMSREVQSLWWLNPKSREDDGTGMEVLKMERHGQISSNCCSEHERKTT